MLRPLSFRRREMRGVLARLAWHTVRDLMATAVEQPSLRPDMVSVIQAFGDRINPKPHVHAIADPFLAQRGIRKAKPAPNSQSGTLSTIPIPPRMSICQVRLSRIVVPIWRVWLSGTSWPKAKLP
jgi:hypothetical protein